MPHAHAHSQARTHARTLARPIAFPPSQRSCKHRLFDSHVGPAARTACAQVAAPTATAGTCCSYLRCTRMPSAGTPPRP